MSRSAAVDTSKTARASTTSFPSIPLPRRLFVPLIGVDPVDVSPKTAGTVVAVGEVLTQSVPQIAPAALAPAAGRICGVGSAMLLDGSEVPAIVLDVAPDQPVDATRDAVPFPDVLEALRPLQPAALGTWIDRLRGAGIWADRWASPDLLAQLNQCLWRPVDTLICNALDLEDSLSLQALLARDRTREMVAGVALLAKLTGATSVWIVIETRAAENIDAGVRSLAERAGVRLVPVDNEYPRANPTLLLHALTRRKLPYGQLPSAHGVLLLDAAAAVSVGSMLFHVGSAPLATPVAIRAGAADGKFLTCPNGTPLPDLLAAAGVTAERAVLRTGGPLRDVRVRPDAVVSGGSELTIFVGPADDVHDLPDPCIRCAWCVEGCPVQIQPAALLEASQRDDPVMAERYGIHACIECGICSYVCPSKLPLLHGIRELRARDEGSGVRDGRTKG